MARFYGKVGYGETVEKPEGSGVYEDVITEYPYFGDVVRNARQTPERALLNNDLTVNNSISIVADAYANLHFFAIRYVEWAGTRWEVPSVDVQAPRLILSLGGVYNGPTPAGAPGSV
jgi:hypothetical protein